MAKITNEEKKAKLLEKKEAAKAKKAAKKAARLEKKRKQAEAKKAKREAKKAKKLALLEKEKAKKAKLREKKRLAKEKQAALKTAKTVKIVKKNGKPTDGIDIKEAAKNIKLAMAQIAAQLAPLDFEKRCKKAKSISWMGYDVTTKGGNVIVSFTVEKTKKAKSVEETVVEDQPKENAQPKTEPEVEVIDDGASDGLDSTDSHSLEVPAGDLYGQNGNPAGEVANIENDDEELVDDEDDEDGNEDDFIPDSRDEQDEDLINHRTEFFSQFGEDFEPNDN